AGDVEAGDVAHALLAQARRKALQVLRLRLADDLDPVRLDVLVVAGEGEPRLLHARAQDDAVQAVVAGDQLEGELLELRLEQRVDGRLDEVFLLRHAGQCIAPAMRGVIPSREDGEGSGGEGAAGAGCTGSLDRPSPLRGS